MLWWEQELCIYPTYSFGMLCPSRQRLPEPCKRHSARTILAFLLPSSPLGQECVGFSSLMQIQPLEKLHSCLITSVALVVVATERLPRARVELSFAQTRGGLEVFRRKKAEFFMLCQSCPSWEAVRLLTPYQQPPSLALFRAALSGVQHSFCVEHAHPGMAGGFDVNPGICNPISHLRSGLVTPKLFIPASTGPQYMDVATCYMQLLPDVSTGGMQQLSNIQEQLAAPAIQP